jgi:hypothetical protein
LKKNVKTSIGGFRATPDKKDPDETDEPWMGHGEWPAPAEGCTGSSK